MGNKQRTTLEKVYHHKYRRVIDLDYSVCFYCGCAAGTEDHVPPLSTVDKFGTDSMLDVDFVLVPACHTCNATLSDKPIVSIKNRAAVLLGRYLETHTNHHHQRSPMQQLQLPPLADGEIYIGAIGDKNGEIYHLILLPGDKDCTTSN